MNIKKGIFFALMIVFLSTLFLWFSRSPEYPLKLQPDRLAYYANGSVVIEFVNTGESMETSISSININETLFMKTCTVLGIEGGYSGEGRTKVDSGNVLKVYAECPQKEVMEPFDLRITMVYFTSTYYKHGIQHTEIGNLRGPVDGEGDPLTACGRECKRSYNYVPVL